MTLQINDEQISTELLHVYPDYSVELQIHTYKKIKRTATFGFYNKYKVKMVVTYKNGGATVYHPITGAPTQVFTQVEWINTVFNSKPEAVECCQNLAEQRMWGPDGFDQNETNNE